MMLNSNFRYFEQIPKSLEFALRKSCFMLLNSNTDNSNAFFGPQAEIHSLIRTSVYS